MVLLLITFGTVVDVVVTPVAYVVNICLLFFLDKPGTNMINHLTNMIGHEKRHGEPEKNN